ncbi:MAG TPA: 2-dehydro-3-deoxyphosphogluconate aldolase [Thermoanaerobaculia bacterium]|nr:2-dehydro-3-deoxyphosphogluconate aldolase [Thermoanaerobaculia bacterium]
MSRRDELFQHVARNVIVGVVREDDAEAAWGLAKTFAESGLRAIEITLTTPDAFEIIARLVRRYGEAGVVVAAGTVRGSNAAAESRRAGAQILVSPHTDLGVIDYAAEHDLMCVAGAATASEIIHAWEAGANLIKIYPAGLLGGPDFIRTIRQPIRDVPMLAGGPVAIEQIEPYLEAGAVAMNLAGALAPPEVVRTGAWDQVTRRVAMAVSVVQSRRAHAEPVIH